MFRSFFMCCSLVIAYLLLTSAHKLLVGSRDLFTHRYTGSWLKIEKYSFLVDNKIFIPRLFKTCIFPRPGGHFYQRNGIQGIIKYHNQRDSRCKWYHTGSYIHGPIVTGNHFPKIFDISEWTLHQSKFRVDMKTSILSPPLSGIVYWFGLVPKYVPSIFTYIRHL